MPVSTNLSDWSLLNRVVMDVANRGCATLVAKPDRQSATRFYRTRQLPAGAMWFAPLAFDRFGGLVGL